MKTLRAQLVLLLTTLLVASLTWGQQISSPPVSTSVVTFPVFTLNASPVPGGTINVVGVTGQAAYYYWAVANYPIGSVLSSLGSVANAANTLSGSNYDAVYPNAYPAGVTTVDILRTTTNTPPSGACNCAVTGGTGLTSGGVNDQSNSLSSYTVTAPLVPTSFNLTLTNEVVSGVPHLILREGGTYLGSTPVGLGTKIADLSTVGSSGVTGSGTAGNFVGWATSSTAGNAPCTFSPVATPTGIICSVGGSTYTTNLTLTGISGASNPTLSMKLNDTFGNSIQYATFGSVGSPAGVQFLAPSGTGEFFYVGGAEIFNVQSTGINMDTGYVRNLPGTFSVLPACGAATEGAIASVTDSTTATWGATIAGSGTNHVLAYCDKTNWTVAGS
jgi:hypothetical protein